MCDSGIDHSTTSQRSDDELATHQGRRTWRTWRSQLGVVLALAVVAATVVIGVASPAPAAAQCGPRLSVSKTSGLSAGGEVVSVSGSCFDENKGIYVAFCVVPPPGQVPQPCGGGVDMAGSSGLSHWISNNPPPYGEGVAEPYGAGGTFNVTLRPSAVLNATVDCRRVQCAIVTRTDHTRLEDRSQDVIIPVSFAADPVAPPPVAPPPAAAPAFVPPPAAEAPAPQPEAEVEAPAEETTTTTEAPTGTTVVAVVVGVMAVATSWCAGGSASTADPEGEKALVPVAENPTQTLPATVTLHDGTKVTVTDTSRILPLWGNLNEMVFALGLGEYVVGRDVAAQFPGTEDLPVVTNGHDVSAEAALSLEPTVVLAQEDTGPPEALDQIRAAGVPVVVVEFPGSVDDIWPRIRLVADALGVSEAGEALVERTQAEIAEVREGIPEGDGPRVAFLYLRGSAGVYLLGGPGAGPDSMIEAAGGEDAGTAIGLDKTFTPLTSEALVAAAPDVLLLTDSGLDSVGGVDALLAMPGIAQTPAAANRRVVTVDDGVLFSFGSRTPRAIAELIEKLHRS